jgi:predicted lipoprotein with Yx(FWY)xxD motif
MTFPRPAAAALSLTVLALIAAGCGGSSSMGSSSSSQPSTTPAANGGGASGNAGTTVTAASNPELGMVVVDSEGLTAYVFGKDKGTTSSCYGACAEAWPPITTKGSPQAGEGATSSQLGTTKRKDGTVQVTYAGQPLYTFVEDHKPGEANGNGVSAFGAEWHALDAEGSAPPASAPSEAESAPAPAGGEAEPAPAESSSGSSGGYGY